MNIEMELFIIQCLNFCYKISNALSAHTPPPPTIIGIWCICNNTCLLCPFYLYLNVVGLVEIDSFYPVAFIRKYKISPKVIGPCSTNLSGIVGRMDVKKC